MKERDEIVTSYIGLGSNLDHPKQQIVRALRELDGIELTRCTAYSSLYRSPPLGPQDQPDYINAVARVQTRLAPHALLQSLQAIEQRHGRIRKRHWGPRTLDLDILLYGEQRIDSPDLKVPHPGLQQRSFVLYPLQEIEPELQIPGLGKLSELVRSCPGDRLLPIGPEA